MINLCDPLSKWTVGKSLSQQLPHKPLRQVFGSLEINRTLSIFLIHHCCCLSGGDQWWSSLYHTFVLITQYILPVIIMAYCYSMMALTIWRNKDLVNAEVKSFLETCYVIVFSFLQTLTTMKVFIVKLDL